MPHLPTCLLAAAVLGLATGCTTTRPDDYPVIEAHHPDGTGGCQYVPLPGCRVARCMHPTAH